MTHFLTDHEVSELQIGTKVGLHQRGVPTTPDEVLLQVTVTGEPVRYPNGYLVQIRIDTVEYATGSYAKVSSGFYPGNSFMAGKGYLYWSDDNHDAVTGMQFAPSDWTLQGQ